jgi:type IV pilus assembly protein PilE
MAEACNDPFCWWGCKHGRYAARLRGSTGLQAHARVAGPWRRCSTCFHGFTLIELMVVLVVVSILITAAYPSYHESVRKAKRAEGRAALMRLMQQQERYFTQNNGYVAFSSDSTDENAKKFIWYSGASAASSAYEVSAVACANERIENCVVLIARPGTEKVDANYKDPACGDLILASSGMQTASGRARNCWR